MVGFMPQKAGFDFRWGFTGAVTDKSEAAAKSDKTASGKPAPKDDEADLDAKMEQAMNEKKPAAAVDRDDSAPKRKPTRRARVTKPRPRES